MARLSQNARTAPDLVARLAAPASFDQLAAEALVEIRRLEAQLHRRHCDIRNLARKAARAEAKGKAR